MSKPLTKGTIVTLKELPAAALSMYTRPIIYIDACATVDDALQQLKTHNILSLPIYEAESSQFIGILHMADLLNFIAFFSYKDGQISPNFENGKKPVSDLIGLNPEGKRIWITDVTDSVSDVMEAMTKGIHRMLIRLPMKDDPEKKKERKLS